MGKIEGMGTVRERGGKARHTKKGEGRQEGVAKKSKKKYEKRNKK